MSVEPKLCTFCDLQPGHSGPHSWNRDEPTPPRDLADAQQRLDQVQGYLDQFIDALADRDKKLQAVREYARGLRDFAQLHRDADAPYVARIYDNNAAALERILGDQP